jgi:hypothetical protein
MLGDFLESNCLYQCYFDCINSGQGLLGLAAIFTAIAIIGLSLLLSPSSKA